MTVKDTTEFKSIASGRPAATHIRALVFSIRTTWEYSLLSCSALDVKPFKLRNDLLLLIQHKINTSTIKGEKNLNQCEKTHQTIQRIINHAKIVAVPHNMLSRV